MTTTPAFPFTHFRYVDTDALAGAVAQRIAEIAAGSIAARGTFRLALAGGETPRLCYQYLRTLHVDWSRVQIYFGDERCLPLGNPQRNDSMAQATLLDHIQIPRENIHCIPAQLGATLAAQQYAQLFNAMPPLDLVLLGLGEDGHTASLFPGNSANALTAAAVPVIAAPKPPAERVSLSVGTLQAARERLFLVAGRGKRDALIRIAQGENLPAVQVGAAQWHIESSAY